MGFQKYETSAVVHLADKFILKTTDPAKLVQTIEELLQAE